MDSLKYSDKNTSIIIDRTGFSHNERSVRWGEIQKCEEVPLSLIDLGSKRYLSIELASDKLKIDNWPADAYMALRIVMKELLQDKVKLDGPRYLKFGPEECEFTISIARFLKAIALPEESKFAYNKAIELIEYYHNLKHELLIEPLTALSSMLKESDPAKAAALLERAQKIGGAPVADQSFFKGISSARTKKEKIVQALEEFRKQYKREPKPAEKARILKEIESE
jgi:hypothetical protein